MITSAYFDWVRSSSSSIGGLVMPSAVDTDSDTSQLSQQRFGALRAFGPPARLALGRPLPLHRTNRAARDPGSADRYVPYGRLRGDDVHTVAPLRRPVG